MQIFRCNKAIIVVDDFDAGSMWEFGFMYAMQCFEENMRIVTYSAGGHGLNVMLAEASNCHITDLEDLPAAIWGGINHKVEATT